MSAIFGLLHLDGAPVTPSMLDTMRAAMTYWGPDGASLWHAGNVGLGHLFLHNTPEAPYESLPHHDCVSGVVLTAHARIDNREDLLSQFEWRHDRGRSHSAENRGKAAITDGDLILHAYLRWGEECVQHLVGDWAFAIWDPRERKLFLARDHHGISGVYYYRHPGLFAFASSIKGLLVLPQVPKRPNLLQVAQGLTSWPGYGVQTAYEDIYRLPPAQVLTVTPGNTESRRYWHLEHTRPVRLGSDVEYGEAFLELYTRAVRCRLRSHGAVGATLSSGLDSGSVSALAARELRARGGRLPVFTSVPIYNTDGITPCSQYGDESTLVEAVRQFIGNLDVHYTRAENVSPVAGIQRALELHDEPDHSAGNQFWIHALMQSAREQGLRVLLTGQMGNSTISWGGSIENFWPLIFSARWASLSTKWKRAQLSPWRTVKRHLLGPVVFDARGRMTRYRYVFGGNPWAAYSAINVDFAQALDLTRRMAASGHDPTFTAREDPIRRRHRLLLSVADNIGAIWAEIGAGYGMEVRDPTMDKRLIEFCLAIPDEQYRGNGQDRWLIRRTMEGLLPDAVRLNTRRGLQAADLGHRIVATLPEVQDVMARLQRSELARDVLDLPKMSHVLEALQKEVNTDTAVQCVTILTRGMMAGMFLLRF